MKHLGALPKALFVVAVTTLHAAPAINRPNIIFLFADELTIGAGGFHRNRDVITPSLDRLAGQGVRFASHCSITSICMDNRCSVLTGLHEYRHGCNSDHGDLERCIFSTSYPMELREAGYFAGFAGKSGFVLHGEPFDALGREFDLWADGPRQAGTHPGGSAFACVLRRRPK